MAVAIPDEEVTKIEELVSKAGRFGVYLKDGKGNKVRFYKSNGVLMCDQGIDTDSVHSSEVIKQSQCLQQKMEESHTANIRRMIKEEHPHLSDDDVDANVDVIIAAGKAMDELKAKGVEKEMAEKLVEHVLKSADDKLLRQLRDRVGVGEIDANIDARHLRDQIFGALPNRRRKGDTFDDEIELKSLPKPEDEQGIDAVVEESQPDPSRC